MRDPILIDEFYHLRELDAERALEELRKEADEEEEEETQEDRESRTRNVCTVVGCPGKHKAKGLCRKHYSRWKGHGDPLFLSRNEPGGVKVCSVEGCGQSGKMTRGWCPKHYTKWRLYGDPLAGKTNKNKKGEGSITCYGYRKMSINRREEFEHILIIEKALGRKIPKGARTHHVDGDGLNNKNQNLVLCDSDAYHQLLHKRQRALSSCGHANWRFCSYCLKYDDPKDMFIHPTVSAAHHRDCHNKYFRNRRNVKNGIQRQADSLAQSTGQFA